MKRRRMLLSFSLLFILCSINIDTIKSETTMSMIDFHEQSTDFIPVNLHESRATHSSVFTLISCGLLCHQHSQCRTLVFESPKCRLYRGARHTGQLTASPSTSSIVGEIFYDNVDLSSAYNQSCDHCDSVRNLVCRDNRCQCLPGTFWYNHTCVPQYTEGTPCNSSNHCRNDLEIVCSRVNKTCVRVIPTRITVTNASLPARFANLRTAFNSTGREWWRAFDNVGNTFWNADPAHLPNYLYLSFNDEYLLTSLQLSVVGDTTHDPKSLQFFLDENATSLAESFAFPVALSNWYTFPASFFNYQQEPIVTKRIVVNITRWPTYQVWLSELRLFGIPY